MSDVVLDFFGFSHLPFSKLLSLKQLFSTQAFKEAFSGLLWGIPTEDLMLVSGPVGCGKSVLVGALMRELDPNLYVPLYVRGHNLSEGELYKTVLTALDQPAPHFAHTAKQMFFRLLPQTTKKPVVCIDDAQESREGALLALKSMCNFDSDSRSRITFILCGQPELKATLKLAPFLPVRQRIRLFFQMEAMSLEETCQYIDHHTKIAGKPTSLFADGAKAEIFRYTEGIARRVNFICFRSILSAAMKGIQLIDSKNLVLDELSD
jgi:type II secretory pathway predicted ATPase ExeA